MFFCFCFLFLKGTCVYASVRSCLRACERTHVCCVCSSACNTTTTNNNNNIVIITALVSHSAVFHQQ